VEANERIGPVAGIDSITIKGFKSIASIENLKLRPINVLIGANGSGKSNFLSVFSFLRVIREGWQRDFVAEAGGADRILHFGSVETPRVEMRISFQNDSTAYGITLGATDTDQLYEISAPQPRIDWPNQVFPPDHVDRWRQYHFHDTSRTSRLKKTAGLNDNRHLSHDGSNLAAFLYLLREKHATSYDQIRRTVQLAAPFFDDFSLKPLELNADTIRLEWRHKIRNRLFDVSALSDGTLRFIALATLFLQPEAYLPPLILVDEPELGLHPYAITLLAALVKKASFKTQIILATQSSMLLDHFNPDDVLVADRVNGGTQLTRLNSTELDSWLEDYSLGELWEKNHFGGRPDGE
jgi:predicted ATPase